MSASPAVASAPGHAGHHDDENKFQIYVQIAMLLAVITGIEIAIVYFPWTPWIIITSLVVLSAVKFMFVIFYFMHLRWDKPFCTILFFIGLIIAGGTMWALLALFAAEASVPLPA